MSGPIPVFFVADLEYKGRRSDYFRLFMVSLVSLLRNTSSEVDIRVLDIGWGAREKTLAKLAADSYRYGASLAFLGDDSDFIGRLNSAISRSRMDYGGFGRSVWYKLADPGFGSDSPVVVSDCDVVYMGDIKDVYGYALSRMEDGASIVAMPDPSTRGPFRGGRYFNSGFMVVDFKSIPPFGELMSKACEYCNDKSGVYSDDMNRHPYGSFPEQDFLNRFFSDNGRRIDPFMPFHVYCPYKDMEEKFKSAFGFDVGSSVSDVLDGTSVCHLLGDKKLGCLSMYPSAGKRCESSIRAADSILVLPDSLTFPLYSGKYFRDTDAVHATTAQSVSLLHPPKRRTVVYANSGDARRNDFLLPSLSSLLMHTSCPLKVVFMQSDGSLDDFSFRSRVGRLASLFGRDVQFKYVSYEPDLECFGTNKYMNANMLKLFSSRLLADEEGYCLYIDSDVLVVNDLSPLFSLCDMQQNIDKVIGCQSHFVVSSLSYPAPAHFMGGFFFMHPSGFPSRASLGRLFVEEYHDNDEYVIAQCMSVRDLVSIGNAVVEPLLEGNQAGEERRTAMKGAGCGPCITYAVHFTSSKDLDRFDGDAMLPEHRRYIAEWESFKRISSLA